MSLVIHRTVSQETGFERVYNPYFEDIYALYSDKEKHIHDVAIHPEYTHYSKELLFPLLNHMREQGGTWKAETRKDTSYALLKKLDERGSITLTENKGAAMGIQGEKLNVISIKFNTEQEKMQAIVNKNKTQKRTLYIS